jgi:SPP1 gp7 family putative phage head morphogenesis protein
VATANEILLDADIAHQIDLHRYSNAVVRRIVAILNRVDSDLFAQLTTALEQLDPQSFTVERLDALLQSVRMINAQAYQEIGRELTSEMRDLVDYEAGFQVQLFQKALPVQMRLNAVVVEQAWAAAMSRPFQGRLLREWAQSIEADRMTRIRDAVRVGFVEGQTTSEIVRRVRGTRAKGYEDGIIEIDRRHAEAVVRTAVSHTAGTARDNFYEGNADLIKALSWTATLDSRTSEICRVRDGKQYTPDTHKPIGHKFPWLGGPGRAHWQCRSCSVPVLKSWKELNGSDVPEFSPSARASMDGQVPAEQNYPQWLAKQSAARQDEILGPTRGALFRKGGLELDRFYNDKGTYLTLEQLRARDAAAFDRAGL